MFSTAKCVTQTVLYQYRATCPSFSPAGQYQWNSD